MDVTDTESKISPMGSQGEKNPFRIVNFCPTPKIYFALRCFASLSFNQFKLVFQIVQSIYTINVAVTEIKYNSTKVNKSREGCFT